VFAANASGNAAPLRTISGSATGLNVPSGIALDVSGNMYVANANGNSVTEYAAAAAGNVAPRSPSPDRARGLPYRRASSWAPAAICS